MIKNVYWSSYKVSVTLVGFYLNFSFVDRLAKNTQMAISMKIRPVETELFHADRRTDMTKPIVTFRNFANAPKKWKYCTYLYEGCYILGCDTYSAVKGH
jgi:hypothetical protein